MSKKLREIYGKTNISFFSENGVYVHDDYISVYNFAMKCQANAEKNAKIRGLLFAAAGRICTLCPKRDQNVSVISSTNSGDSDEIWWIVS